MQAILGGLYPGGVSVKKMRPDILRKANFAGTVDDRVEISGRSLTNNGLFILLIDNCALYDIITSRGDFYEVLRSE